ncbi:MAG: hypothetical protein M1504_01365 [Candidatus Marsarchaeota archaeon]|nr:hypothetical protein [Candidatus Marsarchaeota archaeon]
MADTVTGFVEEIRDLGNLVFLKLYTEGRYIQITVKKREAARDVLDALPKITRQTSITATGELGNNPSVKVDPDTLFP